MSPLPEFARQRLRQQPAGDHPDANVLAAFAEQALAGSERDRVLAHLAACHACRELVTLAAPEALPAPALAPEKPTTWLGWSLGRWASVGAAVVIVGSAVTTSYLVRSRMEAPAPARTVTAMQPAKPDDVRVTGAAAKPEAVREQVPVDAGNVRAQRAPGPAPKKPEKVTRLGGKAAPSPAPRVNQEKTAAVLTGAAPPIVLDRSYGLVAGAASARPAAPPPAPPPPPAASRADLTRAAETVQIVGGSVTKDKTEVAASQARPATAVGGPRQAQATPQQTARERQVSATEAAAKAALARNSMGIAPGATVLYKPALAAPVRWRVAADGSLEHLADEGWESVPVAAGVVFRAVSVIGLEVWAGGNGGAVFHSRDGGQRWERVRPRAGDAVLSADITRIEFTDGVHGKIKTASESWTTADAGRTWARE